MYGGKNSAGPRLKLARVVVWYLQYKYCDKTKMTKTKMTKTNNKLILGIFSKRLQLVHFCHTLYCVEILVCTLGDMVLHLQRTRPM